MTVSDALRAAAARLAEAGVPEPARDARHLMAHAMGIPRGRLTLCLSEPLDRAVHDRFVAAVDDRCARRPVSHITGLRAFFGRSFRVTPDVLDPRPETECLVSAALDGPFRTVLDLGTGSGSILLSLLAERPTATGLGTDVSPAALAVARENASRLGVDARARWCLSDWWQGVTGRFDLIVSNPPYIGAGDLAALEPEVRLHEPHRALSPGQDALACYRVLLDQASAHLSPGGRALFELGHDQGPAVAALACAAGFPDPEILRDLDGRDRVLALAMRDARG